MNGSVAAGSLDAEACNRNSANGFLPAEAAVNLRRRRGVRPPPIERPRRQPRPIRRRVIRAAWPVADRLLQRSAPRNIRFFSRASGRTRCRCSTSLSTGGESLPSIGAHEASIIPVETWPLLRHRMDVHRVAPLRIREVSGTRARLRRMGSRRSSAARAALRRRSSRTRRYRARAESLLVRHRRPRRARSSLRPRHARRGRSPRHFTRVYDLSERIVPVEHLAKVVDRQSAERELLRVAARGHGIGTANDLADYFRMYIRDAWACALRELVDSGEVAKYASRVGVSLHTSTRVCGYRHESTPPACCRLSTPSSGLRPSAPTVRLRIPGRNLRTTGKKAVGRLRSSVSDGRESGRPRGLEAGRADRRLVVLAAFLESHARAGPVAEALAIELKTMAHWLGLESVSVDAPRRFRRPARRCAAEVAIMPAGFLRRSKCPTGRHDRDAIECKSC